jgi:hypothetical protein
MKNNMFILAVVLIATGLCFAQWQLWMALWWIKGLFCDIIPVLMLVCFLLAAVMYAAGQIASSEQRARFHGWATSLLIGAITCGVITVLGMWIVQLFIPSAYFGHSICNP